MGSVWVAKTPAITSKGTPHASAAMPASAPPQATHTWVTLEPRHATMSRRPNPGAKRLRTAAPTLARQIRRTARGD